MAFAYSPKIVTDGLVFYVDAANPYSYVSGSTVWNDISRGGSNGTLTNGPTYNPGNLGSIVFDGINDFVSFPADFLTTSGLVGQTPKTMEIWMTCDSIVNNYRFMFAIGSPVQFQAFFIGRNLGDLYYGGYGNDMIVSNFFDNKVGTPVHLVLTYNGITAVGYYNGQPHISGSFNWNLGSSAVRLGQQINAASEFFNGKTFSARLYNRTLTPSEVLQNYNATKTRFGL